jgi:hypothetical protein
LSISGEQSIEPEKRDALHLAFRSFEFFIGRIADARFEGRKDVILVKPLDRDDEGEAEFFRIAVVELGEAGMLGRRKPVETGARLFLAAVLGAAAGNRQLAGKVRMGTQHAELFGSTRIAECVSERGVHAFRRQWQGDGTRIERPLGNERRVLEDAAEAVDEIVAVDHAPLPFDG